VRAQARHCRGFGDGSLAEIVVKQVMEHLLMKASAAGTASAAGMASAAGTASATGTASAARTARASA
jgi:hypothetical protein